MEKQKPEGRMTVLASRFPMTTYLRVAVVLAGVSLILLLRFWGSGSDAPAPAGTHKEFLSAKHGFSVKYPAAWRPLATDDSAGKEGAFVFAARRQSPPAFVGVTIQSTEPSGVGLSQIGTILDKKMRDQFAGFRKLGQRELNIDGMKALQYDFSFIDERKAKVRERLVVIIGRNSVYHLAAWAPAAVFDRVNAEIDGIIASFAVK